MMDVDDQEDDNMAKHNSDMMHNLNSVNMGSGVNGSKSGHYVTANESYNMPLLSTNTHMMPNLQTIPRGMDPSVFMPTVDMPCDYPPTHFITNPASMGAVTMGNMPPHTIEKFDKCPIICSVLSIICCPMTLCCSMGALLMSMCSYVDYKVHDYRGFRRKSSNARFLIISSCIVSLLLCLSLTTIAYFFTDEISNIVDTLLHELNRRPPRG